MKKLKIVEINDANYTLIDDEEKTYNLVIDFLDIERLPKENDIIIINEKLLDKKYEDYCFMYTFGNLDSKYGRNKDILEEVETLRIIYNDDNKEVMLKRLYG